MLAFLFLLVLNDMFWAKNHPSTHTYVLLRLLYHGLCVVNYHLSSVIIYNRGKLYLWLNKKTSSGLITAEHTRSHSPIEAEPDYNLKSAFTVSSVAFTPFDWKVFFFCFFFSKVKDLTLSALYPLTCHFCQILPFLLHLVWKCRHAWSNVSLTFLICAKFHQNSSSHEAGKYETVCACVCLRVSLYVPVCLWTVPHSAVWSGFFFSLFPSWVCDSCHWWLRKVSGQS